MCKRCWTWFFIFILLGVIALLGWYVFMKEPIHNNGTLVRISHRGCVYG